MKRVEHILHMSSTNLMAFNDSFYCHSIFFIPTDGIYDALEPIDNEDDPNLFAEPENIKMRIGKYKTRERVRKNQQKFSRFSRGVKKNRQTEIQNAENPLKPEIKSYTIVENEKLIKNMR